jgi:hypothetical protein
MRTSLEGGVAGAVPALRPVVSVEGSVVVEGEVASPSWPDEGKQQPPSSMKSESTREVGFIDATIPRMPYRGIARPNSDELRAEPATRPGSAKSTGCGRPAGSPSALAER